MAKIFSDRVEEAITRNGSILVVGIDPDLEQIPRCFHKEAAQSTSSDEDYFAQVISNFYLTSLKNIYNQVAAVKPNLAFFERYGIGGLRAYRSITLWCRDRDVLVIADAKRGDIGSTAVAYAQAFLSNRTFNDRPLSAFEADAVTINPFLGFDTILPFLDIASKTGKGLFILVRTSNPGSADLQAIGADSATALDGVSSDISSKIADWIENHADQLLGSSGISGLGAVVGATRPTELSRLRLHMPRSLFLIPGYGAQGGTATDIRGAVTSDHRGILVNSSRGIFGNLGNESSRQDVERAIEERVKMSNKELVVAGCVKSDE